ncbi:MAG: hypothetical protein AB7G21_05880 [Dehalococcoidia bacterium]
MRQQALRDQTDALVAELQRGLQPFADALSAATTARLQVEAEHAALVQAAAELTAEISKMTGAGAVAVAGYNPADVSWQEQPGWIRAEVGPMTIWFRSAEAQEAYMRASGLAAALDSLARLTAQRDDALARVRQANERETEALDRLSEAEDRANDRLRQHYDAIAEAGEEWQRLNAEYEACIARCERGEVEDQRIGLAGIAAMIVGLTLLILGNPFGFGGGEAQAAGTAAVAGTSSTTDGTATATAAPTVAGRVGPIRAVFSPPAQTTTYSLPIEVEGATPGVDWRGADCGTYRAESATVFRWTHPHPPCDPTTDHADRTIIATIQIGSVLVECRYQGSASGTGQPCTGPGGSTVTGVPSAPGAGPLGGSTASPTPTATVRAAGSTPSTTPTATATTPASGGGSTQTNTPTPTATSTPTASGGGETGGGGSTAATVAGTALTAAGGAAAGYATSRRGGSRTRDEEDEGEDEDDSTEGTPPEPPLTGPRITVSGGATTVTNDRPFTITVETPRPASGDPPETIDVKLRSVVTGEEETVTLRWHGGRSGPVKYESEPLTLKRGGTGGGRTTVFGLEFSAGDMGNDLDGTPSGTDIVISTGEAETRVTAYTTWVQEGIGQHMEAIRQYGTFWRNVAIQLSALPDDTPGKAEVLSQAHTAIRLAEQANRIENSDWLHTKKLAFLRTIFGLLRAGATHDRRDEYSYWASAERAGRDMSEESLWRGMAGATIGLYRTVTEVSGAGAAYTLFTGRDVMDKKVHWSERVFAALDLAGRLTLYPGTRAALGGAMDSAGLGGVRAVASEARAVTNAAEAELHAAEAAKDAAASAAFAERQAAARRIRTLIPDRPNPAGLSGKDLLRAPAGTVVEFTEDFGMLRNRARHFQSVAERYGVRIRVRAANLESLESMARGNPPKHVKLKSKTINALDEVIGAPPNSQGMVGYFDPKTITRGGQMEADYARALGRTPDAQDWANLEKRAAQRSSEFRDQAKAMEHLEHDGLVRVDNGVVVDTGLSNTRLQNGELVHLDGARGGTGRPFTGDHDMWDITRPDGSPVDAATKARIEANLMDGSAATQHGPHKDWVPATDVDRGIDAKIRASHQGAVNPDGSVTPARTEFTRPDGSVEAVNGEGLIEFAPGDRPRVSYETGDRG